MSQDTFTALWFLTYYIGAVLGTGEFFSKPLDFASPMSLRVNILLSPSGVVLSLYILICILFFVGLLNEWEKKFQLYTLAVVFTCSSVIGTLI